MIDKDLFLSLCDKYEVELSATATSPLIKEGEHKHTITEDDVDRVFTPYQTCFKAEVYVFYMQEDYAIAC